MGWHARLRLDYSREGDRTVAHDRHEGPLRVLRRLYPEGPGICHHILLHPPGGVAAGDVLEVHAHLQAGAHGLVTTPGATRFYRSEGAWAEQRSHLHLAPGARLEWLPMEAIAHPGCRAANRLRFALEPGAEMIGWDVLALGLPASGQPFDQGVFDQHLELPGVWLERARIAATDRLLLDSPLGWAGHGVLATAWLAAGEAWPLARRQALLEVAREVIAGHSLASTAAVTAAQGSVLVLRALAAGVEPAMQLLARVRGAWRQAAWGLPAHSPRIWLT